MLSARTRTIALALALSMLTGSIITIAAVPEVSADEKKEPSAETIIDKMLDQNNAFGVESGEATVTLLVEDRTGDKRARKMKIRSKKFDGGGRTLVRLMAPKEVKGQAFLFAENKDSEDDVWMYLPAFSVTRRIEGSQKQGAFLGSHFTFADLESRDIRNSNYKRLGDDEISGIPVYVVESTPKKGTASQYGKVVTYVRKSDYMPLKFRFYGEDGEDVVKTIFVEKIEKTTDGDPYIEQMTLRMKKGGYTTLVIDSIDSTEELPDALFSKDQLGN